MEVWKDIPNYPSYQISNRGHVRRYLVHGGFKEIKGFIRGSNLLVNICNVRTCSQITVKTIVAKVFGEGKKEGFVIRLKDGNPHNCSLENLIYLPNNEVFKAPTGKRKVIRIDPKTNEEKLYETIKGASIANGISESSIHRCLRGDAEISCGYKWKRGD